MKTTIQIKCQVIPPFCRVDYDETTNKPPHGKYKAEGFYSWLLEPVDYVYYLYGKEVTEEEYREHQLTIELAGLKEQ